MPHDGCGGGGSECLSRQGRPADAWCKIVMARSRRKREAPPAQATAPRIDAGPTGTPHADGQRKSRRSIYGGNTKVGQRRRSKRVNGNQWRRK